MKFFFDNNLSKHLSDGLGDFGEDKMPNNQSEKSREYLTIETFAEGGSRDWELVSNQNRSVASGLVWYVAISGFALINVNKFAESIAGRSLAGVEVFALALPWALSSLFAIITHTLVTILINNDMKYYRFKQHLFKSLLATNYDSLDAQDVMRVLNADEEDNTVVKLKKDVDKAYRWTDSFNLLTKILLTLI